MRVEKNDIGIFDETTFIQHCDSLAKKDKHLKLIIDTYSYPPLWKRKHGFETLIHIILEQQVSLASAKAALKKLKGKIAWQKTVNCPDSRLVCPKRKNHIFRLQNLIQ